MTSKVNLFIIGASKCGTTSLWHMLNSHSNIYMSTPKEPWFFSFSDYKKRMNWYESLFQNVKDEKILGDASPIYSETTLIPELPKRIHDYNHKAKIIYIVREPLERIRSVWRQTLSSGHWNHRVYKKYTDVKVPKMPEKFEDAVFSYPPFIEACKYWTHLNNYRKYFEDKDILLLFFEDLKARPELVYQEICQFLEIEPQLDQSIFEKQNSSLGKRMYPRWYMKLKSHKKIYSPLKSIARILGIKAPGKTINYDISISPDIENKIKEILRNEINEILSYGGKPKEYWN